MTQIWAPLPKYFYIRTLIRKWLIHKWMESRTWLSHPVTPSVIWETVVSLTPLSSTMQQMAMVMCKQESPQLRTPSAVPKVGVSPVSACLCSVTVKKPKLHLNGCNHSSGKIFPLLSSNFRAKSLKLSGANRATHISNFERFSRS